MSDPNFDEKRRMVLCNEVLEVFKRFGIKEPSVVLTFLLPPEYRETHWISNVKRSEVIKLLRDTTARMEAGMN